MMVLKASYFASPNSWRASVLPRPDATHLASLLGNSTLEVIGLLRCSENARSCSITAWRVKTLGKRLALGRTRTRPTTLSISVSMAATMRSGLRRIPRVASAAALTRYSQTWAMKNEQTDSIRPQWMISQIITLWLTGIPDSLYHQQLPLTKETSQATASNLCSARQSRQSSLRPVGWIRTKLTHKKSK